MFQDKYLTCKDCGNEFLFSAAEQEFYAEKGFTNEPGRCPACRQARKQRSAGSTRSRNERPRYRAICASCGQETTVPFEPTAGRPIYCRDCFQQQPRRRYAY
ncbi:MAG: zinc-binding protein [Firmicutes bacterium]|nr:zinc-binding protein [Bacillota bacterium]